MAKAPLEAVVRHIRKIADAQMLAEAADGQLVDRFVGDHEESAFAALLRRHGPMVLSVCRGVLGHREDAEDVFQATFLLLARKARSIRKRESVASWLHGVAYRLAVRAKEQRALRRSHETKASTMRRTGPRVEEAWEELRPMLQEEMEKLPEKYRTALLLYYWEGKTQPEVTRELGCPIGTVQSRLGRGRKLLQERLTRRGFTLSASSFTAFLVAGTTTAPVQAKMLEATLKACLQFATAKSTGALVSAPVAALVEGGLQAMLFAKLKVVTALLLAVGLAAGAGALAHQAFQVEPAERKQETEPPPVAQRSEPSGQKPARTDRYGDPLPVGAVARLGTARFLHAGILRSVAFSSDGKTLAAVGDDVRLWDVASGRELQQFSGQSSMVFAVAFSPDEKLIASAGVDRNIRLWDVHTGKEVQRLTGHQGSVNAIAYAPDGKTLASGGDDQTIRFWDLSTGAELRRCAANPGTVSSLQYTRDGRSLVSASYDNGIHLWEVDTGKDQGRIGDPLRSYGIALSPDDTVLAAPNGDDVSVSLWQFASRKKLKTIQSQQRELSRVAFSRDGKMLATGGMDGNLRLWDVASGSEIQPRERSRHLDVWALALAADGKLLATGSMDHRVRIWGLPSLKQVHPFQGHTTGLASLVYSPDGLSLISTGYDGRVCVWDAGSGNERRQFVAYRDQAAICQAYAPGRPILLTENGDKIVHLWDLTTGKERQRFDWCGDSSVVFCFCPDGKIVGAGLRDHRIRLYDVATGKELRLLAGEQELPYPATFSPDGKLLAATCFSKSERRSDHSSQLKVWSVATGEAYAPFQGQRVTLCSPLAFSRDGKLLAAETADQKTQLWDVATGQKVCHLDQQRACALAFSPDGRSIASGHWDGTVSVWEVATGKGVHRFEGHKARVFQLAFSPDGKRLASGSEDNTALVWDLTSGRSHPAVLSPQQLESYWTDLSGTDAARAYQAQWALAGSPQETTAFLKRQLQRIPPDPAQQQQHIRRLIAELDSDRFKLRQRAAVELERLGKLAEPALHDALRGQPSTEARRRMEAILAGLQDWTLPPDTLTGLRIIGVLEQIGTPEAKEILQTLAKGAPEARLTQEAKASLERLAKRP